jgi:phage-related protein
MGIISELLIAIMPVLEMLANIIATKLVAAFKIIGGLLQMAIPLITTVVGVIQTAVGFISAIIQSLVAIFTGNFDKLGEIWSNFGEKVKEIWANIWQGLKDGLVNGWKSIWDGFTGYFKKLIDWFKNLFGIHSPSKLMDGFGRNIMEGLINGIKGLFGKIKDVIGNIADFFKELPSKIADVGGNIITGIWEGISGGAQWLKDKITGFAGNVATWFKKTFKINSPSKLMADEVGLYVGQGIGQGVLNSLPSVKKDLSKFGGLVSDNLGGLKNGVHSNSQHSNVPYQAANINAGLTVNYNGKLSRKELYRLEKDNYTAVKMRLRTEGLI